MVLNAQAVHKTENQILIRDKSFEKTSQPFDIFSEREKERKRD